MKLMRHPVAALVLFAVLTGVFVQLYSSLENDYSVVSTDDITSKGVSGNLADHLANINLLGGIEDVRTNIANLKPGTSTFDILGSLASAGIGVLKLAFGIFSLPYEIVSVIVLFYGGSVPASVLFGLLSIFVVYGAFILLSAYLRQEV